MNDAERLSELSQFLRTRRERLGPADVGLAPGRRRRTPGLRREEVAQLAGVSATWYTWLEQGRPVRASEAVLERLGRVLRLDPAEHRHLFVLARGHPPADPTDAPAIVDARLQAVLDALPYPAYAATNGWTVVAWNRAARLVFVDYEALSGRERNIVWMAFMDPDQRRMAVNWEEQARSALALFRASTAQNVGEDWHKRFVADLAGRSPEFRDWWSRHDVRGTHAGPKLYDHPIAGRLVFEPMTLRYEDETMLWVMIKVPVPDTDTPARLARLLADSPAVGAVQAPEEDPGSDIRPTRRTPDGSPRPSRRR
jgi:transcriptional regulator with XRE-family HTH domain